MRGRKLRWVVAGLAVALLALGACVLWPRANRVTPEDFNRIKEGMNLAEVEAILGPPGDYRSGPTVVTLPAYGRYPPGLVPLLEHKGHWQVWASQTLVWETDEARVVVGVLPPGQVPPTIFRKALPNLGYEKPDPGGVISARYDDMQLQSGPLDNLLWRLKRQWRRWFPEK